jgi:YVTN family beta-propeller protein
MTGFNALTSYVRRTSAAWLAVLFATATATLAQTMPSPHPNAQKTRVGDPGPALLVLNKTDATLAIIDPASGKIVGRVPTGEGPHEVAASADGKLAFVANYGGQTPGNTISVIALASQRELRRFDVSPLRRPHGLYVAESKLFFTAEVNRAIARYDPTTDKIDWLVGTGQPGTHMVLANKDVSQLFTANIGGDSMCVIDRGANPLAWNVTVVPVGKGPEGFDLSPDGKELWTAHSRDGGVSVIDVSTKKVTQTIDVQTKRSNRLKFTPDGKHVLISDLEGGDLVIVDTTTRKLVKRVPMGKQPEGILIVPDGSRAYVAVAGDNQLAVVDLKSFGVTGHIQTGAGPDGMAWVPKGLGQ